jgi:hypothetical protein
VPAVTSGAAVGGRIDEEEKEMKRNIIVAVGAIGLVTAAWAVTHAQDRPQTPTPPPGQPTQPQQRPQTAQANEVCPVGLQGMQVQAMTIPEGGALQFVVDPTQVNELRSRLQRFARMHGEQMQQGGGSMGAGGGATGGGATGGGATGGGATGGGGAAAAGGQQFADTSALIHQARDVRVVEIPNGARLEVRMSRAPERRLEDLRTELRQDAQQMTQGRCPLALQIES